MNVLGNFHLLRDELEAALNAFSNMWALHQGVAFPRRRHKSDANTPLGRSFALLLHLSALPSIDNANDDHKGLTPSPVALVALNNLGIVHERRGKLSEVLSCLSLPCCWEAAAAECPTA